MSAPVNLTTALVTAAPTATVDIAIPSTGNTLVVVVYDLTPGDSLTSITMTGGTFVQAQTVAFNQPSTVHGYIYIANNLSSPGASLMFTCASSGLLGIVVREYSGMMTTGSVVDQIANNFGSSATADSGQTPNTLYANEVYIGGLAMLNLGVDTTPRSFVTPPTNNFMMVSQVYTQSGGYNPVAYFEYFASNITQADVSASSTNGVGNWGGMMVTLIDAIPVACPVYVTAQDFINEIRTRFAEVAFTTWVPDVDLIRWLNLGLDDIVFRSLPPNNEHAPITFTINAGQYTHPVPADYFRLKQFGDSSGIYVIAPNVFNVLLFEDKSDDLEEFLAIDSMQSCPVWFWIWNNNFYVYPVPDQTYTYKIYYYRLPAYVCLNTDPVDIQRPWGETLIKFVCWKVLEKDKHPMAQVYRQQYEQALSNMYSESRVKIEKRARYVHSHDFWGRENR